ncbi:MAG: extracellular solute-binding protein [Planctomycetes bacterium]|nr:extracellular solute-binding protein [Planctomycetota bacterium]
MRQHTGSAAHLTDKANLSHFSLLTSHFVLAGLFLLLACPLSGCRKPADSATVVLYTSVDEPFAREVVAEFEKQSGIRVQLVTDTEAGKTTGLVRRIEAEKNHPRADVFWSSELFNTIRLARAGLLAEYRPPAEDIPDRYQDPAGRWTAFGARARVLAWNTANLKREDLPTKWRDLADPKWAGKLAVADPRFGTTTGHFAAMYALWGEADYVAFLQQLNRATGGVLMDGNATCTRKVGAGELLIGATDTDDVYARQERREPIDLVYPDMGDGGTLLVPNSVGLVAGAPHAESARVLLDFLTSPAAERLLAVSGSRNIPVRESLRRELKLEMPPETNVPFDKIADALEPAIRLAAEHLIH